VDVNDKVGGRPGSSVTEAPKPRAAMLHEYASGTARRDRKSVSVVLLGK